jgi:hypothetical protein
VVSDLVVFNDGRSAELVKLKGTVPIYFKKVRYNIPVAFWLLQNFPDTAPLCFVEPTPGEAWQDSCLIV